MGPYETPPAAEAFDDVGPAAAADDVPARPRRLIWLIGAVLALTLVVLAGIIFSTLTDRRSASVDIEKLPIVRADEEPYKVQPEQPGGLDIPNRDKLIYGRLRGQEQPGRVERLIPAPERPMPPPLPPRVETPDAAQAVPPAAAPEAGGATAALPPAASGEEPLPLPKPKPGTRGASAPTTAVSSPAASTPTTSAGLTSSASAPSPAPVVPAPPIASPPSAAPASASLAPPASAPKPPAAGGGYRLQIAALPTEARATAEWGRISARHGDVLRGLKPEISRADLGERGVVYRLRVGPVASEQSARALCQSLSGRGIGCLVVAPRG